MTPTVELRDVTDADVRVFFEHIQDEAARTMAAFVSDNPTDIDAHAAHWTRIRATASVVARTILCDEHVVGHVATFERDGDVEVTFWIDRAFWRRGIARAALAQMLVVDTRRPMHGRVAADNIASRRVLEACAFTVIGEVRGFAIARGEEIDELILRRDQ